MTGHAPRLDEKKAQLRQDLLRAGKRAWHWDAGHKAYRLDHSGFENDGKHWVGQGLHHALTGVFDEWQIGPEQFTLKVDIPAMTPHLFLTRSGLEQLQQVYRQQQPSRGRA